MLIQRNLHLKFNIKALLIGTGAATGVIMVINLLSMYHCGCNTINQSLYTSTALPIFFILGIIITSSSFEELQSSAKGCFYLTLPVSNLERLASAWLVGSVIYYIYWMITLFLINILIAICGYFFLDIPFGWVNMFTQEAVKTYIAYFIAQSVFLFGAVYFSKNNLIKTVFAMFVIGLSINLFASIFVYLVFGNFREFGMVTNYEKHYFDGLTVYVKYGYWFVVAPFSLLLSYIRLKERQV